MLASQTLEKLTTNQAAGSFLCPCETGVEQAIMQEGKDAYLLQSFPLCEHLYPPAGKDPFCWEACCNWRIWKQSFKQFIVAMEVALSINRSWSNDVRWPETGRHSMLLIKSLCCPSAWDIICQTKQLFIRWWKCVVWYRFSCAQRIPNDFMMTIKL